MNEPDHYKWLMGYYEGLADELAAKIDDLKRQVFGKVYGADHIFDA